MEFMRDLSHVLLNAFHRNVENAGYMRSLISKIVTNVRVNFENVVIKYVESDIVFSVNVGEASLTVADKNWKATFVGEYLIPECKFWNYVKKLHCLNKNSNLTS